MNEFNVKVKLKEFTDDEQFVEAMDALRDAVIGERLRSVLDDKEIETSVIQEILKYFRCKYKETNYLKGDTFEKQLEYCLHPYGIMYRSARLEKGWYHNATGIMLGTMKEDGVAVLLKQWKFGGYVFVDPHTEKLIHLNLKTEKLLDEEVICFYPSLPSKSLEVKDLMKFMFSRLTTADILFYVGTMAAVSALGILTPLFTKILFGSVLQYGNLQTLVALGCFMICYCFGSMCLTTFQNLMKSKIITKQDVAVQAAFMSRVIHLPSSFFAEYGSGELYYKIESAQSICSTLFDTIGTTGLASLFSLIYIGQIFRFAPGLVLPSLFVILSSFVVSFVTAWMQSNHLKGHLNIAAKTSGMTYALVKGIQKIKLAGAEKRMFAQWAQIYADEAHSEYTLPLFLKFNSMIQLTITLVGTLVLYVSAIQLHISVANFYAFSSAYGLIASAFAALANACRAMAMIQPMLEMAKPILKEVPENGEEKEIITDLTGSIEIRHLSFCYEDGTPNVIDDLNLSIRRGEYVAITGATGCGKSTLLRLLLGFEKPKSGTIFYDRHDMQDIDLSSLRKQIGTVQQNSRLFPGDILSNITISNPLLSEQEAWDAAELAAIAEEIRKMPMGMRTIISEGQGGISGGQKQRLLIARALAPNPKILFFDEATSALDNITQKKISDAIDSLQCTRIVIAHRLSTIQNADRILYLENGKILEQGTYSELMQQNGKFAELVERQCL